VASEAGAGSESWPVVLKIGAGGGGGSGGAGDDCDGDGGAGGGGGGVGRDATLVAGINVPTGRQRGIPSRQTRAPSPSLPERRAMISCSIVISTVSMPPRSTYQSGLSPPGGSDAIERIGARGGGCDFRSVPERLSCGTRGALLPSAAIAASESTMCVCSSSESSASVSSAFGAGAGSEGRVFGAGAGSERKSGSARSMRTN
jgi:hypothetical protein